MDPNNPQKKRFHLFFLICILYFIFSVLCWFSKWCWIYSILDKLCRRRKRRNPGWPTRRSRRWASIFWFKSHQTNFSLEIRSELHGTVPIPYSLLSSQFMITFTWELFSQICFVWILNLDTSLNLEVILQRLLCQYTIFYDILVNSVSFRSFFCQLI